LLAAATWQRRARACATGGVVALWHLHDG